MVTSGMRFGRLTTTALVGSNRGTWRCLCDCERSVDVFQSSLLLGKVRSCGCNRGTQKMRRISESAVKSHRRKDLTGQKFNWLTAIKFEGIQEKSGNSIWSFKCECTREITRVARQVVRGDITSCGCRKKELLRKANTLPENRSLKNQAYYTHLKAAEKRSFHSKLTQEQYDDIIAKPCTYCGGHSQRKTVGGAAAYLNSVDRRNNEPFYDLTNSIPCCFVCQKVKGALTEKNFLNQIKRIYEKQNLSQLPCSDSANAP